MAQTKAGAIKISAKLRGMSPEELQARRDAGEKWCYKCRQWRVASEFAGDKSRSDGRKAICQSCDYTRKTSGPGVRERKQKQALGLAYCSKCKKWLPIKEVKGGLCRPHIAEAARIRYQTDERVRKERRQHAHARKNGVDPVPIIGQEILMAEFEGKCAYCGAPATTWDHIIPISKGGKTVPWNIVPCCVSCNSSKNNNDHLEWVLSTHGKRLTTEFVDRLALEHCPHLPDKSTP